MSASVHVKLNAAAAGLTKVFVEEFEACLGLKQLPPMEHFLACIDVCKKHKLVYELEEVHPRFFLIHIANRDYLMMKPKNAHKRGAEIKASGADLTQLSN